MLKSDASPTDLEACRAFLRRRFLVEEQQDKINESLARALANAKFEIEQLKRYIYGKHRKHTAHFSTTE